MWKKSSLIVILLYEKVKCQMCFWMYEKSWKNDLSVTFEVNVIILTLIYLT